MQLEFWKAKRLYKYIKGFFKDMICMKKDYRRIN